MQRDRKNGASIPSNFGVLQIQRPLVIYLFIQTNPAIAIIFFLKLVKSLNSVVH
ncbi:hypothetical protein SAMN05216420_10756 [Nitrosospira sp. Nl5]|nr:hypothetical protein SAMN05216420_10756 [Nitrosospira sp. Nl5]